MRLRLECPVLSLQPGEVITLDDAAGVRIEAREGTVWITEEDDREDHIVNAKKGLVIASRGRTIVQALAPSWIAIDASYVANDATLTAA
jgi:hypothetical protein